MKGGGRENFSNIFCMFSLEKITLSYFALLPICDQMYTQGNIQIDITKKNPTKNKHSSLYYIFLKVHLCNSRPVI